MCKLLFFLLMTLSAFSMPEISEVRLAARKYLLEQAHNQIIVIVEETVCVPTGDDFNEAKGIVPTPECNPNINEQVLVIYRAKVNGKKVQLNMHYNDGRFTIFNEADWIKVLYNGCEELKKNRAERETYTEDDPIEQYKGICDEQYPAR